MKVHNNPVNRNGCHRWRFKRRGVFWFYLFCGGAYLIGYQLILSDETKAQADSIPANFRAGPRFDLIYLSQKT
jgi:hypothetical protein